MESLLDRDPPLISQVVRAFAEAIAYFCCWVWTVFKKLSQIKKYCAWIDLKRYPLQSGESMESQFSQFQCG